MSPATRAMRAARRPRRAFTLVELLVVISIFVIVLAIAVPAFSSMLYSSDQALSDNALRQGLQAARDVAARNAAGEDAAAVFFFEPGGRVSIAPYVKAGVLRRDDPSTNLPDDREVFVPVPGIEPVQLPRGWGVRGLARPGTINDQFYGGADGTYGPQFADADEPNWIFPQSGFYNSNIDRQGAFRQTFMVRFAGGTGHTVTTSGRPVLAVSPSPSNEFRDRPPWSHPDVDNAQYLRADAEKVSLQRFVRRVLAQPTSNVSVAMVNWSGGEHRKLVETGSPSSRDRELLIGPGSTDVVSAVAVGAVATYNERRLAAALGERLDRDSGTLYRLSITPPGTNDVWPAWVGAWSLAKTRELNAWIEGRFPREVAPEPDARVYVLGRYLGTPFEVTGTRQRGGVTP